MHWDGSIQVLFNLFFSVAPPVSTRRSFLSKRIEMAISVFQISLRLVQNVVLLIRQDVISLRKLIVHK